jgi:hydroxypyruvate isomerase
MERRAFLATLAATGAAAQSSRPQPRPGRLKQAVTRGCFRGTNMDLDEMCRHAARMGVTGFDLTGPKDWPVLKKYGLTPTMASGGGGSIADALNRVENHARIEPLMRQLIDDCAAAGAPNLITFSGNRRGQPDEEGIANCVTFLNKVKSQAEDKGVTICMEYLNSKVNHPDYAFDNMLYGVEVCKRVNSPRVKILFDIYHVQIMEGDIIRTIRDNAQYIAHFHTAGNPGRHEMDDTQELNYKGIARAIADLGFDGWVAHEYSPAPGRDALKSLEETLKLFEV